MFLHSFIYNGNKNICKFIKKRSMKKKMLLATAKQLIRKNSVYFSQSEHTDRLDPFSHCSFSCIMFGHFSTLCIKGINHNVLRSTHRQLVQKNIFTKCCII